MPLGTRARHLLRIAGALTLLCVSLLACGCAPAASPDSNSKSSSDIVIFATTGYLADAAKNVAPDATVITMVGPGGDPHSYQPTTKDIEQMRTADLVLWNGLHLEAHMHTQLESLGSRSFAVGESLAQDKLLPWSEGADSAFDPHIWNDPELWSAAVGAIAAKLGEINPVNAAAYLRHGQHYQEQIAAVQAEAQQLLERVAPPRILVSGHDAFEYFGRSYDLEVYATDFISSEAVLSATEMDRLARLVADKKVPAIFLDNQVNPQAITSLSEAIEAKGWRVRIPSAELYADSLGSHPDVDTYLEVVRHNAQVIATELGG